MKKQSWMLAGAAVAVLMAGAAQADTIYKYRGSDGEIVYSNSRPKGVEILGEMDSKALSADQQTIYSSRAAMAQAQGTGAQADAHLQRLAEADASVLRAQQNLRAAQAALQNGREPLPGERIGTADGYSRLNQAYEARVGGLERAVELAQQQLDQAYQVRARS